MNISNLLRQFVKSELAAGVCAGLAIGVVVLTLVRIQAAGTQTSGAQTQSAPVVVSALADLRGESASPDVFYIADWVTDSRDAAGLPFVIVDKTDAKVYVFDGQGRLRGTSPVLLGGAKGDDTVAGIGIRPIEEVLPEERTTPAGRFVAERGHNARGEDVVWVDYDAAVSMHRVLTINPGERRLERLASPSSSDNRISYGCINVPVAFFETYIQPVFAGQRAIVYVLPEVKSLEQVFGGLHNDNAATLRGIARKQAPGMPISSAL